MHVRCGLHKINGLLGHNTTRVNYRRNWECFLKVYRQRISCRCVNVMAESIQEQHFDYFLVLDFEATCDNSTKLVPQEIIEFPVLKVSGKTFQTEATFHQYVEPSVNKELTPFCTELTGIVQDMVDGQPDIKATLKNFDQWMSDQNLLSPDVKSIFVTCGDWDLKTMLPGQCNYFGLPSQDYFHRWINVKRAFSDVSSHWPKGMMPMLKTLGLPHQGRHHSGIDDCKNIANIVKALAEKGYVYRVTGQLC